MPEVKVILKEVKLNWVTVDTPKAFSEGDTPRYTCTMLVQPGSPNHTALLAAIDTVGKDAFREKWAGLKRQWEGNSNKWCYLDGGKSQYEEEQGFWCLRGSNKTQPTLLERDKKPAKVGRFYSGCVADVSVSLYAQTKNYPGIRCNLNGLRFVQDGEMLGGSRVADADEFEDLSEDEFGDDVAY